MLRRIAVAILAASVLVVGACGKTDPQTAQASKRKVLPLETTGVGGDLRGLKVVHEDVSATLKDSRRPYFDRAVLYSLRDGDQLEATLQIGRFAKGVDTHRRAFRSALLATIGGGTAKQLRMGNEKVYLTAGDRQSVAVWFRDPYLFILSSREDYKYPRSLLRQAMALQP